MQTMNPKWLSLTLVGVLAMAAAEPSAPEATAASWAAAPDSSVTHTLRLLTETAHHPYLTWPDYPHYQDELEALYEPGGYGLLWFENGKPSSQAREAVEALLGSDTHGLDPTDYDAARLAELMESIGRELDPDGSEFALVDAALSVGFLRYLSDLHVGRVNPENLSFGFNVEDKKLDLAAVVSLAIAENKIRDLTARVEPGFPQYDRMQEVLANYRALAGRDLPGIPVTGTVHPGDEYAGTEELLTLLVALGDLPPGTAPAGSTYDGDLVGGVERFQARHGLAVDGAIGDATFAALNTPMVDRVHQIELALERLRWLPDVLDEPLAVVNVPAFELWALDPTHPEDRIALEMRVVVGKAVSKQTPAFRGDMRYIVMSPYWNVPYSIAVNEILPALKKDPGYLDSHNMEIVREFSWDAMPLPVTADNINAIRSGRLNIRQRPGGRNSLGPAKFIFPNSESIYFHGTPAQQLFARTRRDFSHGCIRLEDPLAMADWVLRDQGEWTTERIDEAMHAGSPSRANLTRPLPVIIFYTTVMADEAQPYFYTDIYGHDRALDAALQVGYPYPP
jgi:murein L,D-transpeptidase YcbB/YkuD